MFNFFSKATDKVLSVVNGYDNINGSSDGQQTNTNVINKQQVPAAGKTPVTTMPHMSSDELCPQNSCGSSNKGVTKESGLLVTHRKNYGGV